MPITDIGSYVTTGSEFEAHWTDVDADRIANSLAAFALPDGFALADLSTAVAAVTAVITSQQSSDNALSIATSGRDAQKEALRDRVIEFRKIVDYRLKGSVYVKSLPDTPLPGASEQKFLRALDDMADLWTRINADSTTPNFTPPLVFADAYALAAFETDVAALRTQYKAVVDAENDARIGRKQRDALLEPLRDRFVSYRQGIEVEYGEQHAFTQSLPDVYPQPGSTPDAVTANGQWDENLMQAVLTWTASTNPNLVEYGVRMTPGATYDSNNASVIGNLTPGFEQFETAEGLANPGDVASYKIYVLLSTGNEAGSNTVTITRP